MGMLQDKVIVVTGAGNGIGEASAKCFAAHGARLLISDIAGDQAERVAAEIRAGGAQAQAMTVDVTDEAQVIAMVEAAVGRYGRLDGALNNAGGGCAPAPTADVTLADMHRVMDLNFTSSWLCTKYEIQAMLKTGGGSIVATASDAGLLGTPNMAPYAAAKAALINLIRTAAVEYGKHGIRLNAVCPGATATPALQRMAEQVGGDISVILGDRPIPRLGEPREVAEAAAWLLSDLSSFVTGQPLAVDGGFNAAFT